MNAYVVRFRLLVMFVLCCAFHGCEKQHESEQAARCRTELAGVIQRLNTEGWAADQDVSCALSSAFHLTDDVERKKVLLWFADRLFSVEIDRFRLRQQIKSIEVVKRIAQSLLDDTTDFSKEDTWRIRIKLLAWIRARFERIKQTEPETVEARGKRRELWTLFMSSWDISCREIRYLFYREWAKRNPLYHNGLLQEQRLWRQVVDGEKDYMWRSVAEKCVRDLESFGNTHQFRIQSQKELEGLIGRSLRDDDFWSIPVPQNPDKARDRNRDVKVDVNL